MPDETRDQPEPELSAVIASYLEAVDEGRAPDPDELLARHPHLAAELRSFLAVDARMAGAPSHQPRPDTAETVSLAPARTTGRDELPAEGAAFGAYDLLELVGEGGMGVVYKARHRELGRVVALKLILAGRLARPSDLERFWIEARAAARLSDEGIVRLYEVGNHDGLPFIVSEFCPGGSLDKKLARKPVSPGEAGRVVAGLAAAVQQAHDASIVHRDLKPGNVLIAADGRYKIGDFGLAKLLDEGGTLSATNAILGSPPYMSPEQAEGRGRLVGRQSDVYSLGAILYELLTGRPPFRGATPTETLRRVVGEPPVPPHRLNRSVPADLETICLRCLEKSPALRFATARDLADELNRFLRGEPIRSRPVGPLGRGWRWCRRNPVPSIAAAVVVATATVAVALIARSRDEAVQWAEANGRLAEEKGKLADDMTRLAGEKGKLAADLEVGLAGALLAPVSATDRTAALTPYEVNAFRQLAARRGTRVGTLFIAEGLRTPAACEQLACRAEVALHAAIGLDPAARDRADELFRARLRDPATTPAERITLSLVLSQWEPVSRETAEFAAARLAESIAADPNPATIRSRVVGLVALAGRLDPAVAAPHCDRVSTVIADGFSKTTESAHQAEQAAALALLTPRIEAGRAVELLAEVVIRTGGKGSGVFSAAVARLEPGRRDAAVTRAAEILVNSVLLAANGPPGAPRPPTPSRQPIDLKTLTLGHQAWALQDLAVHMDPDSAVSLLTGAIAKLSESRPKWELRRVLAAVAKNMETDAGAELLLKMMSETTDPLTLRGLAKDVSEVAARMPPVKAADAGGKALGHLVRVMEQPLPPPPAGAMALDLLAAGIEDLRADLPPAQVAGAEDRFTSACDRAVESIVGRITKDPVRFWDSGGLVRVLPGLAQRANPTRAAELIMAGIEKTKNDQALGILGAGLAAVAPNLKPDVADEHLDRAAKILTDAIASGKNQLPIFLAKGVAELARRMKPEKGAALISNTLKLSRNPDATRYMAEAFGGILLDDPKGATEARELAKKTIDELIATSPQDQPQVRTRLYNQLTAALAKADPDEAAGLLLSTLRRVTEPYLQAGLVHHLSEVLPRMKPDKAAAARDSAAKLISDAVALSANTYKALPYARGLRSLAVRMDPVTGAAAITTAMHQIVAPDAQRELLAGLHEVAARLTPEQAAAAYEAAAGGLTRALTRPEYRSVPVAQGHLAWTLSNAAKHLPPAKAAAACDPVGRILAGVAEDKASRSDLSNLTSALGLLTPFMTPDLAAGILGRLIARTTDSMVLGKLGASLAQVAGRMEPEKATAACESAATTLRKVLAASKNHGEQKNLADGLAALAGRMERQKAAAVADETAQILLDAMTRAGDPIALTQLGQGVAVVAGHLEPARRAEVCGRAAGPLGNAIARTTNAFHLGHLAGSLAEVAAGMEPGRAAEVSARAARLLGEVLLANAKPPSSNPRPRPLDTHWRTVAAKIAALAGHMNPREAVELLTGVWNRLELVEPRELTAGLTAVAARIGPEAAAALLLDTVAADPTGTRGQLRLLGDIPGFALAVKRPAASPALAVAGPGGLAVGKAYLPVPGPLPPQVLVDLLKHPFCVGEARRVVLDALEVTYDRPFADHWEFVKFARESKLPLDLLTPPRPPLGPPDSNRSGFRP
jgi:tRNA A-37 threonylcarbamoyl transferase component Bud32